MTTETRKATLRVAQSKIRASTQAKLDKLIEMVEALLKAKD